MPKADLRKSEILGYLYAHEDFFSANDLIDLLRIPKPTVYDAVERLAKKGFLKVSINPEDRVRKYKLSDNYREWYKKGEELGIPLPIMTMPSPKEERRRLLEEKGPYQQVMNALPLLIARSRGSPAVVKDLKKEIERLADKERKREEKKPE